MIPGFIFKIVKIGFGVVSLVVVVMNSNHKYMMRFSKIFYEYFSYC